DGDKPYGDYILWRQILNYIKETKKPLIFVTSEEKEDWWEKGGGKTVGPLYDLLKEFYQETGQSFLLFKTARFLEYSSEQTGKTANLDAVAEIREIATQRYRDTPLAKVLEQNDITNNQFKVAGQLLVEVLEPTYKFTCSGHFSPRLSDIPNLRVTLSKAPTKMPNYSIRFGTGTTFDFHVHLKSTDFGEYLPMGQYTFEYEANIIVDDEKNTAQQTVLQ
ncbi:MAG: PIN-like domain-containing protein, partial [Daejeonella sp.]